jgi:hypothetical protein
MPTVVSLSIRNRAAAVLFIATLLALGAVFLTLGLALLAGLVVAGGVVGAGMAVYRMIRGGNPGISGLAYRDLQSRASGRISGLDPSLEVSPTRASVVRASHDVDTDR